ATKRRISWAPEAVEMQQHDDPFLRYTLANGAPMWPEGTAAIAAKLDELGVDVDASSRKAMEAYRAAGLSARNKSIPTAVNYRKLSAETDRLPLATHPALAQTFASQTHFGTHRDPLAKPLVVGRTHLGTHGTHPSEAHGSVGPSIR